jgi:hypothetical protein
MENDDFIERLRNKEIAQHDQREAGTHARQNQQEVNAKIQANARSAFDQLHDIAHQLTADANSRLEHNRFDVFPAAGGFCIKLGRFTAGFSYAPPLIANMGTISMNVYLQELDSNFAALGFADEPEPAPPRRLRFEPAWDDEVGAVLWSPDRVTFLSGKELVQEVMEQLITSAG